MTNIITLSGSNRKASINQLLLNIVTKNTTHIEHKTLTQYQAAHHVLTINFY